MGLQISLVGTRLAVILVSAILVLSACGKSDSLEGVYSNSNGQSVVEFRGDKAFVTMVGMASDGIPYEVKGDKITIHAGGIAGDLVLTRNSDGTLQGPFGVMRKKT